VITLGKGVRITISDLRVSAKSPEFMEAYMEFTKKVCMNSSKHIIEDLNIGHAAGAPVPVNP